ncbi:protein SMG8 [Drosophila busckii]|uniref:protein SMG8 n=1 Tax=Drosophila busckii TaxID=30019 RepID=UPI001432C983|nr:protein SMG8 [Drosophila busckii]
MISKDYYTWKFADAPPEDVAAELLEVDSALVVAAVIGKSADFAANKMCAFDMERPKGLKLEDGQILCYFKPGTQILFLHFETTYDEALLSQLLAKQTAPLDIDSFYEQLRNRFVRQLLLALHVCHIVLYVEIAPTFDRSLPNIFQLLKFVREQHLLEFMPQLLRESGIHCVGDKARLCAPRLLFLFENYPEDEQKTRECISAYEFETEDIVYEQLRQHHIVNNTSNNSLLALPNNKQFVFYNAYEPLRPDYMHPALELFKDSLYSAEFNEDEDDFEVLELAPFEGFARPTAPVNEQELEEQSFKEKHNVWHFLQRHVQDALNGNYDEGSFKQQTQAAQCKLLSFKDWLPYMQTMQKFLIAAEQNASFASRNAEYQAYVQNFEEDLSFEKKFWLHLCELGLKKGIAYYKQSATSCYDSTKHKQLLADAFLAVEEEGVGPYATAAMAKLNDICSKHWQDGRQMCEQLSLRGFPCTHPKDLPHDKHFTGVVHVSTCNCGRTQGRRDDPYTLRQANYDYYEGMANMCSLCLKVKKFHFPVFAPSTSEYRAAAFEAAYPQLRPAPKIRIRDEQQPAQSEVEELPYSQPLNDVEQSLAKGMQLSPSNGCSQPMSATYGSDLNMSIVGFGPSLHEAEDLPELHSQPSGHCLSSSDSSSSSNDEPEMMLQCKTPMVRVGKYTFTLGSSVVPRLTQSAYWILRLPYVYQGDNELLLPPERLQPENKTEAYLLANMFGIAETESMELKDIHIPSMTFTRL